MSKPLSDVKTGDRLFHPSLGVVAVLDIGLSPRDVGTGMGGEGGFSVRTFTVQKVDGGEQFELQEPDMLEAGVHPL